jgi:predicted nucleotidyltransferase component of viral defense system
MGYRKILGFNLGQVEKDYLQHLVMVQLARSSGDELVFKGGTCLQKVYGLNRFSQDLDFTQNNPVDIEMFSSAIERGLRGFGYPTSFTSLKKRISAASNFKIQGPLYQGTKISLCSLHLEISGREEILIKPEFKTIYPVYEDLPPYTFLIMEPVEILAEKLRALTARNRARDLYDIHFLLKKNTAIDWHIVEAKMQYYEKSVEIKDIVDAIEEKEKYWKREMPQLVPQAGEFKDIKNYVVNKIKNS